MIRNAFRDMPDPNIGKIYQWVAILSNRSFGSIAPPYFGDLTFFDIIRIS
jgi:hypothetical protein